MGWGGETRSTLSLNGGNLRTGLPSLLLYLLISLCCVALTLYNTLTRRKEPFEPLRTGKVRMYYCDGLTTATWAMQGLAVWDVVRRYLQWRGYNVQYVQNFTDDKILNRARIEGSSMESR